MSITRKRVRLKRRGTGRLWFIGLALTEVVLTFFLYVTMAANIVWPEQSQAAVGVAKVLSYEGRLTDTSGNPLGGTGTVYCFRFSIYDNPTVGSGTKLWPTGAPSTTTATVTDGTFDVLIGSADTLDYNFYSNDTVYLNVEANTTTVTCGGTWENLSPRQRIAATGYALTAGNVYGDLLKTDISNTKVQLGTGTGVASGQILMALDVKNTTSDTIGAACSPSGTLWYNSVNTRALVCDNATVQEIGNLGTIVGIKEASAGSAISSGTVVFSGINGISVSQNAQTLSISGLNAFGVSNIGNTLGATAQVTGNVVLAGGNNITLSQNGSTITISGGAGGGATLRNFEPIPLINPYTTTFAPGIGTWYVQPFVAPAAISSGRLNILQSMGSTSNMFAASNGTSFASGSTGTRAWSYVYYKSVALYTMPTGANSTRLDSMWSNTWALSISESMGLSLTNATQLTGSHAVSMQYIGTVGSNGAYTTAGIGATHNASAANSSTATSFYTSALASIMNMISGAVLVPIGFNTTITPGNYWLGQAYSISSTTAGTSVTSNSIWPQVNQVAVYGMASYSHRQLGRTASSTMSQPYPGVGIFSIVSAAPPTTIAFTDIRSVASNQLPYFNIIQSVMS